MFKVEDLKEVTISGFNLKEWLGICALLFKDGAEEMMRNANCFVI